MAKGERKYPRENIIGESKRTIAEPASVSPAFQVN